MYSIQKYARITGSYPGQREREAMLKDKDNTGILELIKEDEIDAIMDMYGIVHAKKNNLQEYLGKGIRPEHAPIVDRHFNQQGMPIPLGLLDYEKTYYVPIIPPTDQSGERTVPETNEASDGVSPGQDVIEETVGARSTRSRNKNAGVRNAKDSRQSMNTKAPTKKSGRTKRVRVGQ